MKAQFDFSDVEKRAMLSILGKYPTAPEHHHEVKASLSVGGSTVLWPDEVMYLAGIVGPYYSFLAERLLSHPAVERQRKS